MSPSSPLNFDVREVISDRSIETHFQPVVSVRRKKVLGVEALSRGVFKDGSLIPPLALFAEAAAHNCTFELDRACRLTALQNFLPLYRRNPKLILFLNCFINNDVRDADNMLEIVRAAKVDPRNVAVEVLESQIGDSTRFNELIENYKRYNFLVVIDDLGVGYSNLSRIVSVKPDIFKTDLSLVRNIHREYHKQEVFKSLIALSERIGGWVITEGVEEQDEAVTALKLGADIFQGFFFARPQKPENESIQYRQDSLEQTAKQFKQFVLNKIKIDYYRREQRNSITNQIAEHLTRVSASDFEAQLRKLVGSFQIIESACVIDDQGKQSTDTVTNVDRVLPEKTIIFEPPGKNTDHTLKEYYYALKETRINVYETAPYVPLPSEQLCITTSTFFRDVDGKHFILCLHLKTETD